MHFIKKIVLGLMLVGTATTIQTSVPAKTTSFYRVIISDLKTSPVRIAQTNTSALEQLVHQQVNQYRVERGLVPLVLQESISEQARTHSQEMAATTVPFGHDGFPDRIQAIAKAISLSAAAENVAYNKGYSEPATEAVQGWLNSRGHRQNIEGKYNKTGIGIIKNASGEYYFTQIFVRS